MTTKTILLVEDSATDIYLVQRAKGGYMGLFLFWLGLGWALVGVINLLSVMWAESGQLFYFLLFILPGLLAAAIGAKLYARSKQEWGDET